MRGLFAYPKTKNCWCDATIDKHKWLHEEFQNVVMQSALSQGLEIITVGRVNFSLGIISDTGSSLLDRWAQLWQAVSLKVYSYSNSVLNPLYHRFNYLACDIFDIDVKLNEVLMPIDMQKYSHSAHMITLHVTREKEVLRWDMIPLTKMAPSPTSPYYMIVAASHPETVDTYAALLKLLV